VGVPTLDVGFTSATTGRGDHEVHVDMWLYWNKKVSFTSSSGTGFPTTAALPVPSHQHVTYAALAAFHIKHHLSQAKKKSDEQKGNKVFQFHSQTARVSFNTLPLPAHAGYIRLAYRKVAFGRECCCAQNVLNISCLSPPPIIRLIKLHP
jgi:hypothetical protein